MFYLKLHYVVLGKTFKLKKILSWLNKLDKETDLLSDNTISYCLAVFVCGGPRHFL